MRIVAVLAASLLLFTGGQALRERTARLAQENAATATPRPPQRPAALPWFGPGRCAISHARFGSKRAHLVKVMKGDVPNFVVIEVGKRDPMMAFYRRDWVRSAYGSGEQTWLGEYGSAKAALAKASHLCPPSLRCWPGETGCGPADTLLSPFQMFMSQQ